MIHVQSLPWCSPLDLAASLDEACWVLLYSGAGRENSSRFSLLAHTLAQRVEGSEWERLKAVLSDNCPAWENAWFGYLGYGLKNRLETLAQDQPAPIDMPDLCMMRFSNIYVFDHTSQTVSLWSDTAGVKPLTPVPATIGSVPTVNGLASNMSRNDYLQKAGQCIERIRAGELYQANLTRKFHGTLSEAAEPFSLFCRLCEASPADYSAYLRIDDMHILSSSPELFLDIGADGMITSMPIKGSAPRDADPVKDTRLRESLAGSAKNRAENLMIVDLVRNDLSRSCLPGSINAPSMFAITSHRTIHHMSSTVQGRKRGDCSSLQAVMACFPPGSMTGAPKIRAMQLCSILEGQRRGVYSGAIGWFGGDGSARLSVVIRTLVLRGRQFEFQVGGGIVSDSTPEEELSELLDKAAGIATVLGLSRSRLEAV